jgi:hypothetical protein
MSRVSLTADHIQSLSALAEGIVPRDNRDDGAATLNAGQHLADKIQADLNNSSYVEGLQFAEITSKGNFGRTPSELDPAALEKLLAIVRERSPAFFKFLRTETCGLYLSQPAVWKRIGFPGPSIESGGYPDFDRRQDG